MTEKNLGLIILLTTVFANFPLHAQITYVPGGSAVNSNNGYMGIGTTVPAARFHLQQSAGGWSDGIRLSLMSKSWDIVSDASGNRLVFSAGQNPSNAVFMYAPGFGPTMHVNGDLKVNGLFLTSGDAQTHFAINPPATFNDPFQITLGYQNINGGIMIGRTDWQSKVMIPWQLALGANTPSAKLHLQQSASGWDDGIRIS